MEVDEPLLQTPNLNLNLKKNARSPKSNHTTSHTHTHTHTQHLLHTTRPSIYSPPPLFKLPIQPIWETPQPNAHISHTHLHTYTPTPHTHTHTHTYIYIYIYTCVYTHPTSSRTGYSPIRHSGDCVDTTRRIPEQTRQVGLLETGVNLNLKPSQPHPTPPYPPSTQETEKRKKREQQLSSFVPACLPTCLHHHQVQVSW